eukprot:jgi/Mesvir1/22263/Mv18601-RA.1
MKECSLSWVNQGVDREYACFASTLAAALPKVESSAFWSAALCLLTLLAQQLLKNTLASTKALTLVGGFVSSLVFVFLLTLVGNLQEKYKMRTSWVEVIFCMVVAACFATTIHGVSVTTCVLFSILFTYEMNKISTDVRQAGQTATVQKKVR